MCSHSAAGEISSTGIPIMIHYAPALEPKRQYFLDGYYIYSRPKVKFKVSSSYFDEKLQSKGDLQWPYFETAFDSYFYTLRSTSKLEYNQQVRHLPLLKRDGFLFYYSRIKETYLKDLTTLEETLLSHPPAMTRRNSTMSWSGQHSARATMSRNSITSLAST